MLQLLLESSADPNIVDEKGETSLFLAVVVGYQDLVKQLLDKGAIFTYDVLIDFLPLVCILLGMAVTWVRGIVGYFLTNWKIVGSNS